MNDATITPVSDTVHTWKTLKRPAVDHISITTGASCSNNQGAGRGGYAAILQRIDKNGNAGKRRTVVGSETETTNQQMELRAALAGLKEIKNRDLPVVIVSKSQYLLSGISRDLANWKAAGWRRKDGGYIANSFLWVDLAEALEGLDVYPVWSKTEPGAVVQEATVHAFEAAHS